MREPARDLERLEHIATAIEKTRHILVHDYYQIDNRILWSIIKDDMNPLKQQITQYISEKTNN